MTFLKNILYSFGINTIVIKDAHKIVSDLQARGASKDLAEGIVDTIQRAELESQPATVSDLANVKTELVKTIYSGAFGIIGLVLAGVAILIEVLV